MKEKFILVGKLLFVAWVIQFVLFRFGGDYQPQNLYAIILTMGPVAGSCILAVIVSEIADKKRREKNERETKVVSENPD